MGGMLKRLHERSIKAHFQVFDYLVELSGKEVTLLYITYHI